MAQIKLKHVNSFYGRHGKLRHLFRCPGTKSFTLPGLPGSLDFMDAYQSALARIGVKTVEIGAKRTTTGSVDAAIVKYYRSDAFTKALAAETQRMRRNILERFRAGHGGKGIATLQRGHVLKLLEGMTPHAQKNWLKTLRGLMLFAVADGMRGEGKAFIRTNARPLALRLYDKAWQ